MEKSIRGYTLNQITLINDFFTVYEAEHTILSGQKLMITLINEAFAKDSTIRSAFNQSIFRLSFAEHKNLVKNIDMIEENENLAILSEYANYSDFDQYLHSSTFDEKIQICKDVFELFKYLHSRNIFVTDLRPQNILLGEDGCIKLSNLGLMNIILNYSDESLLEGLDKYLTFTAPEICNFTEEPGIQSDIYTLGAFVEYVFKDYLSASAHKNKFNISELKALILVAKSIDLRSRYSNLKDLEFRLFACLQSGTEAEAGGTYSNIPTSSIYVEPTVNEPKESNIDERIKTPPPFQKTKKQKPKITEKKAEPPKTGGSMNYHDILAEIEAEKGKRKEDIKRTQNVSNEPKPRSSHTVFNSSNSIKKNRSNVAGKRNSNQDAYNKTSTSQTRVGQQQHANSNNQKTNYRSQPKVNTSNILVLGIIGIIFSLALPFIGFILSIIGLAQIPKNNRKVRLQGRKFTSQEKIPQKIGTVLCIFALIIAIIRMIVWFVGLLGF